MNERITFGIGKGTRQGWNAAGDYRVREVDMFDRRGEFSDVLSFEPQISG